MSTPAAPGALHANFSMLLDGRSIAFSVPVPTHPVTLPELLPALFEFNRQLLAHAVAQEEQSGRSVSCRAGCGACCRQLVPIGSVEAALLREWLDQRPAEQAQRIRGRFIEGVERLEAVGLRERLEARACVRDTGQLRSLGLDYFRAGVACPFLVEDSCSVYEARPMKCREYLVTSPAINCAKPSPEGVSMVGLPGSFLRALLALERWSTGESPSWLPLILLLDTVPVDLPTRLPGTEWFERFVTEFARSQLPQATA